MFKAARTFFEKHLALRDDETSSSSEDRLRLAVAALLVEVVRADDSIAETERASVLAAISAVVQVEPQVCAELLSHAEREAEQAHDLFQFTSRINLHYSPEQKQRLVEQLWLVAQADTVIHKYEEHLIRRIADLLHVPHSIFIAAKLKAQSAAPAATP